MLGVFFYLLAIFQLVATAVMLWLSGYFVNDQPVLAFVLFAVAIALFLLGFGGIHPVEDD